MNIILLVTFTFLSSLTLAKKFKINVEKSLTPTEILKKYKSHHKKLCNPNISCSKKEFILFKPVAGLGDTLNALEAAFIEALKSGNLIFIDWHYFDPKLTFTWEKVHFYRDKVENCDILKKCQPLLTIEGHLTFDHEVLKLPQVNDETIISNEFINSGEVKRYIMEPSKGLQEMIDENNFDCDASVVIRTGENDSNEFLHKSDHEIFTMPQKFQSPQIIEKHIPHFR